MLHLLVPREATKEPTIARLARRPINPA